MNIYSMILLLVIDPSFHQAAAAAAATATAQSQTLFSLSADSTD